MIFFFNMVYQEFKSADYLYDFMEHEILSKHLFEKKPKQKIESNNCKLITADFYDGFGIDI